ncbi:hypothetical protein NLU13_3576 [Sarocladium strictum]|uniref:Glycoside hydrolase n=1 Tax=Sarocladium strictum TaxID=5046 RepID=A0AA39LAF1_SARSR|nr:hypothetical protein NLU13_3576 [Sarocladium strictum]
MSGIPAGAVGTVVGVLVYCCICFITSITMIWLSWTHDERTSYVAMLSYFATISIAFSLIQQIHDLATYQHLVQKQFENAKAHPDNPEIVIANGSTGFSLVMYYIQYYCYNVEAMCVMFWAAYLAQSVYGLSAQSRLKVMLRRINDGGKIFAMLFPLTTILLLRVPQIQNHFVVFILIADLPLMLSLLFGCILMVMIVGRYVHTRRKFLIWSEQVGNSQSNIGTSSYDHTVTTASKTNVTSSMPNAGGRRSRNMWDRWLLVRFTIAFLCLSIFEVTNTLFQIMSVTNADRDAQSTTPDFSAARAKRTWVFFMPGVTPGLFIFVVFGTTTTLRKYMYQKLVPKRWQRRHREEREAAAAAAASSSSAAAAAAAARSGANTGPPVPPKDGILVEVEMQVYHQQGSSRDRATPGTDREDTDSIGSDEFPILPIQKNRQR